MIEFPIQIDSVSFNGKPKGVDVSKIKPRLAGMKPIKINIKQLANAIIEGKSFSPAVLRGGAKADNWHSQQVFCIDIDNEDKTAPKGEKRQSPNPLTLDEVFKRCNEWNVKPALIYETFSSSERWLKFRIVFIANKIISDSSERDNIQFALMEIFPECDTSCKNRDRLFFGGKSTLYIDEKSCFDPAVLNTLIKAEKSKQTFEKFDRQNRKTSDFRLEELKRTFDFLGYIRQNYNGTERKAGHYICINPCPVCGHNDDFIFYPDTNTFMCFGANGNKGGSVIDFLMYTKNIDKTQAIDMFKYELCGLSKLHEKAVYRKECMVKNADHAGIDFKDGELPSYIIEKINEKTGEVKYSVSCPLLAKYIREHCHYISINDRLSKSSRMFWYDNGVYKPINDDMLQGFIKKHITTVDETLLRMRDVLEVMRNLKTDLTFVDESLLNADENIINFQNGLLYLNEMKLYPHSPDVLTTIQIPCNYDPDNRQAPVFTKFLQELTEGDKEKAELLLEYMGVCISNIKGFRMKQALFMYGKGNTGKSQLKSLTEKLLGRENYSNCDLSTLEERFGTSQLYMKRLSGSSDMSFVSIKELKIFKCATGGDDIFIEFKGKDGFSFKYNGLLWYCMNELPNFGGDRGQWVYERIITFDCNNVIPPEKQDKLLLDKMYEEREAIINLLIPAVQKVKDKGYRFSIPEVCRLNNEKYAEQNSPVRLFIKECCERCSALKAKDDECTTGKVYDIFKAWYSDNVSGRIAPPSDRSFRKELAEIFEVNNISDIVYKTAQYRFYPLTINLETKIKYQHIYGFYKVSID